jgi:hypothetical protein
VRGDFGGFAVQKVHSKFPVLLLLAISVLFVNATAAQTFRGGLGGTVSDPQGAAIVGALVAAVDDSTAQSRQTVTTSAGTFVFQDIPQGSYTVTINASGFEPLKVDKVIVSVGAVRSLQLTLPIAKQSSVVEVSAAALSLDTASDTQNATIPEQQVQDAPLNGRFYATSCPHAWLCGLFSEWNRRFTQREPHQSDQLANRRRG